MLLNQTGNTIMAQVTKAVPEAKSGDFEHEYHYSEKHGNSNCSDYVRHNIDVFNDVMGLQTVYQTGLSYYHGDYSLPSAKLELSVDGGTDSALVKLNDMTREDIAKLTDIEVSELVEYLDRDFITNMADICQVYELLIENNIKAQEYLDNLDITPVFQDNDY